MDSAYLYQRRKATGSRRCTKTLRSCFNSETGLAKEPREDMPTDEKPNREWSEVVMVGGRLLTQR